MTHQSNDDDRFVTRQRRLFSTLACPFSGTELDVRSAVMAGDAILSGELWSPDHGKVGVVRQFQPTFLERDFGPQSVDPEGVRLPIDLAGLVSASGRAWEAVHVGWRASGEGGESLTIESHAVELIVTFFGHDWSGVVRIRSSAGFDTTIDLYRLPAEDVRVRVPLGPGPSTTTIEATGRRSGSAIAPQVVLTSIEEVLPAEAAGVPALDAINRGNPYPERFRQLVAALGPDAIALDCGGGDRRFGDDRVFNLEYMAYRLPDLYGDGLHLPFATGSFDLILSQAVLEHVPDPQRAVDEMVRVLKPGGLVYLEVAFMQPLHAVPSHYMNVTPYGLEHLCQALDVLDSGVFGGLTETFSWIGRLIDGPGRIGEDRYNDLVSTLRELDETISPDELKQFASAVYMEGRKREAGEP